MAFALFSVLVAGDARAEADPFSPIKCDRPFPTVGTRYVEIALRTLTPPAGRAPSFMVAGEEREATRTAVEIDQVSGARILRARFAEEGWAPEAGATRWEEVRVARGGVVSRASGLEGPAGAARRAVVGDEGLPFAIAGVRAGADPQTLAAPAALLLEEAIGEGAHVTVGPVAHRGDVDEYPISATGERSTAATCHGLTERASLRGTLTVRARDGALVAMALAGDDVLTEDVCNPADGGRTRLRDAPFTASLAWSLRRPCFAGP